MKFSKQRELILNYVLNSDEHPTADTIYSELKKDNPELSLGTVYRNLTKLSEIKTIRKINFPNQSDRFDKNLEKHSHLICENCKSIVDINIQNIDNYIEEISNQNNIIINLYDISFNGICNKCKK